MENSLKSAVEGAKSVLILLPSKPFFDQVAAGLSLYLALKDKKGTTIVTSDPMTVEFNRLIGVNKVGQELGNKNLIIKFSDYKANDIERVSYDIEDREFRLTVIPKPGVTAPQKEQVELGYSGVSSDLVILIGGANESHFPALNTNELAGAKIIHIGIKELSINAGKQALSLVRPASSVSEVVASLIKESGYDIDSDVATNLLMGIEDGSNKFAVNNTSASTFALISELMRMGGKRGGRTTQAVDFPPGAIPGVTPQPRAITQPGAQDQSSIEETRHDQSSQDASASGQTQSARQSKKDAPKDWLEPKIYKGSGTPVN